MLWAGCAGVGAQHCPFGLHALRGAACRGGSGRPSRGEVAFQRFEGQLVSGRPLGRAARVPRSLSLRRGSRGRGDPAPAQQGCGGGRSTSPGGGAPRHCDGAPGLRRLPSPGCPSMGRVARARRSLAVGAGAWAWVCRPSVGRAAGPGCMWCVWFLCGVCVLVGAWRCGLCRVAVMRGAASLRSLPWCLSPALPRVVVLAVACGYAPFPARVPCSATGYPPSSFCVVAFLTLSPTLRWSALLPRVHLSLPHLLPCVCLGIFPCLLPCFLGPLVPLLLDPVRQRKAGGVGCCGGTSMGLNKTVGG